MGNSVQEGIHQGEFLLSEGEGTYSRDVAVLVPQAAALPSGQLLGKLTTGGKYTVYDNTKSDGSETCVAVLYTQTGVTAADKKVVVISRLAEVTGARLTGLDAPAKADLQALGIIVR